MKGIEQDRWILYSQVLQCGLELKNNQTPGHIHSHANTPKVLQCDSL